MILIPSVLNKHDTYRPCCHSVCLQLISDEGGRARLCYHIGGNPSVHNRGQPGVKPRSDYNLITTFTFTIAPRWQHQWEFSFGIWDIEKFEHKSVLLTIFAPFLTTPHYEVINNTWLLFYKQFSTCLQKLVNPPAVSRVLEGFSPSTQDICIKSI